MATQIGRIFVLLSALIVFGSPSPKSAVAQVSSRWSLELTGGLSAPVGKYDTRTYPNFGGAGGNVSFIARGSFRLSNRTFIEIGYGNARFGSDLADTLDRTLFIRDPDAYEANGTVHTLQPALRLEFLDGNGRVDPFVRLGLVVAWGRFNIDGLSHAAMLRPGESEVDLDAHTRTGAGFTMGGGTDIKVTRLISAVIQAHYVYVSDSEILYFGESAHQSDTGDHFGMTWFDVTCGIRLGF